MNWNHDDYQEPQYVVAPPSSFHAAPTSPPPRGFDSSWTANPRTHHREEKGNDFFDCCLSSAHVYPVDSDDDCSMSMSELSSCDDDIMIHHHGATICCKPSEQGNAETQFDLDELFKEEHDMAQHHPYSSRQLLVHELAAERGHHVDASLNLQSHGHVLGASECRANKLRLVHSQDSKPSATSSHYPGREPPIVISFACSPVTMNDVDSQDDGMSTTSSVLDGIASYASCLSDELLPMPDTIARYTICHFERLPNELICIICNYLDVESLSQARLVNTRLLSIASQDDAGWKHHCQILWSRKAHVSKESLALLESGNNARRAFYHAGREAVSRQHVLPQELCFDTTTKQGIIWSFRFKATAGTVWTSWDPWWTGSGRAREMVFLLDGRVMQYVRGSKTQGDYLVRPFQDTIDGTTGMDVRWRLISQPMDLPKRPQGSYLRLTIGGRDVPTYVVHRSPTGNWGFVMESCWGVHASFPLKPRKQAIEIPLERPARIRLRRTSHGEARWLNVADMESEDEADETTVPAASETSNDVLEDSALTVTTAWQWREAILHNQGFRSLPEGEDAAARFGDEYWSRAITELTGEQRNELGV